MFAHTNGVNTHKGAIFLLGLICGAIGVCWDKNKDISMWMNYIAKLAQHPLQELRNMSEADAKTGGEYQFFQFGLTGARGEAASGFHSVISTSLPEFRAALNKGYSVNDAGLVALVALMQVVDDSNVLRRGGYDVLNKLKQDALAIWKNGVSKEALYRLDKDLNRANISPGGSADLLAVTLFLYFLETDKDI